jgi:hypothetical protein
MVDGGPAHHHPGIQPDSGKIWPSISGCLQFLILITVSAAAFGMAIGVEWLIAVMHAPWND